MVENRDRTIQQFSYFSVYYCKYLISIGLLKHLFEYLWLPLEIIELPCFSEENKLYLSWKIVLKMVLAWNFTQKTLVSTQKIWFDYQHWKIWKCNLNRIGFKKLVRIRVIGNWDDSSNQSYKDFSTGEIYRWNLQVKFTSKKIHR